MLTVNSRLLRATRASSGEAIVTNANPLFLVLLYIASLATTEPKPTQSQTPISKGITKNDQNPSQKNHKLLIIASKEFVKTSTSTTVPYFSNIVLMSSGVQVHGTFWASNLVSENSSVPGSTSTGLSSITSSWAVEENWSTKFPSFWGLIELMRVWWVCEKERESEKRGPETERLVGLCLERWCGFCRHGRGARVSCWRSKAIAWSCKQGEWVCAPLGYREVWISQFWQRMETRSF